MSNPALSISADSVFAKLSAISNVASPPQAAVAVPQAKVAVTAPVATAAVALPKTAGTKRPAAAAAAAAPKKRVAKKDMPHVLIWVCHCGPGRNNKWTGKNLKVVGVYKSKEAAEAKKMRLMDQYQQCGHGDIMVGDSWEDEIDLVVRPAEECDLD